MISVCQSENYIYINFLGDIKMKVLVDGYWNLNLGDDLFLKILTDYLPQNDYSIIVNENQKSESKTYQSDNA